jgi:NADH dehydrogenase
MADFASTRVVVLGAGFAGLWAARALAGSSARVRVIDRNNYHLFLPLLYQVAAAELEPEHIAYPVRAILRGCRNVQFELAEVRRIDPVRNVVITDGVPIPYDTLVVATGSTTHYFGIPGAEEHAFPLKSLEHGIAIRNHILLRFERASHEPDARHRQRMVTMVIVGGGPTGVEFAGALAELVRGPLVRDYPDLDSREVNIVLVEAAQSLLPGFGAGSRDYARGRLEKIGVDVRLGAGVRLITEDAVHLQDGTTIPTETVVWTAGVRGDAPGPPGGMPFGEKGQVPVLPTLQVPGHPDIYVIGDLARVEQDGRPLPMVAPVATQEGSMAGRNILRQIRGLSPLPFRYRDSGMMLTLGRNAAVAHVKNRTFTGFPAWLLWLSVHLVKLIGFRNRLLVLINWAWDYFFFEKAVRLILPADRKAR